MKQTWDLLAQLVANQLVAWGEGESEDDKWLNGFISRVKDCAKINRQDRRFGKVL